MRNRNNTGSSYLSRELFERTVPVFKRGLEAREELSSNDDLPRKEKVKLRQAVSRGSEAYAEVCDKAGWIIERAVKNEMDKPRNFHVLLDAEDLRQAGFEAVWKMMRKADPSKMDGSAVNYLMQWVNTDVSRAAMGSETSYGMSSNKLKMMRKIAAVRSKLASKIGRDPTDEEVFEFFQNGGAKISTKYGQRGKDTSSSSGITLDMINEQRRLEHGTNLKFPVTDLGTIDSEVSSPSADHDYVDDSSKNFWTSWFRKVGIAPDQWDKIAGLLDLYDIPGKGKIRKSVRLIEEFQILVGSEYGDISGFADEWMDKYGDGPWNVFVGVRLTPGVEPGMIDEDGRKIFRTIRFVNDGGND